MCRLCEGEVGEPGAAGKEDGGWCWCGDGNMMLAAIHAKSHGWAHAFLWCVEVLLRHWRA